MRAKLKFNYSGRYHPAVVPSVHPVRSSTVAYRPSIFVPVLAQHIDRVRLVFSPTRTRDPIARLASADPRTPQVVGYWEEVGRGWRGAWDASRDYLFIF